MQVTLNPKTNQYPLNLYIKKYTLTLCWVKSKSPRSTLHAHSAHNTHSTRINYATPPTTLCTQLSTTLSAQNPSTHASTLHATRNTPHALYNRNEHTYFLYLMLIIYELQPEPHPLSFDQGFFHAVQAIELVFFFILHSSFLSFVCLKEFTLPFCSYSFLSYSFYSFFSIHPFILFIILRYSILSLYVF